MPTTMWLKNHLEPGFGMMYTFFIVNMHLPTAMGKLYIWLVIRNWHDRVWMLTVTDKMQWPSSDHSSMHRRWGELYGSATMCLTGGIHAMLISYMYINIIIGDDMPHGITRSSKSSNSIVLYKSLYCINLVRKVTSHERRDVSNHQDLDGYFSSFKY